LIELISIENTVDIYDFALIFELNKLLNKLKIIDKELYNLDSFSKINKFLGFAIKSQNLLMIALGEIAVNNPDKDLKVRTKNLDSPFPSGQWRCGSIRTRGGFGFFLGKNLTTIFNK
jgi:hypothetical protein